MKIICTVTLLLVALAQAAIAASVDKPATPATPFVNPYLADSTYNVTHSSANFTPLAGPTGPSRKLKTNEKIWSAYVKVVSDRSELKSFLERFG